jgi:hypothetical protein
MGLETSRGNTYINAGTNFASKLSLMLTKECGLKQLPETMDLLRIPKLT